MKKTELNPIRCSIVLLILSTLSLIFIFMSLVTISRLFTLDSNILMLVGTISIIPLIFFIVTVFHLFLTAYVKLIQKFIYNSYSPIYLTFLDNNAKHYYLDFVEEPIYFIFKKTRSS